MLMKCQWQVWEFIGSRFEIILEVFFLLRSHLYDLGAQTSGKKVVSSEAVDLGSPRGAKLSARQQYEEDEDEDSDYVGSNDRPIRPKATTDYNDRDPEIEPMGIFTNSFNLLISIGKEMDSKSSFQNGEHPLEGVPNLGELPTPEDLKGLSK